MQARARGLAGLGSGSHGLRIRLNVIRGGVPNLGSIAAWQTSSLANAFSPLGPSMSLFIEPLSSSTRAKSIGVAQGGLGEGGGDDGDGGGGLGDGGGGLGDGGGDDGEGGGGDGGDGEGGGGEGGGGEGEGGGGEGDIHPVHLRMSWSCS